jgi:hypothetical protein
MFVSYDQICKHYAIIPGEVYRQYEEYIINLYNNGHSKELENDIPLDILYLIKGNYYKFKLKNNKQMKKYYIMAIDKGNIDGAYNLGCYYHYNNNYIDMKKYFLMAIEKNDGYSMYNLGHYYQNIEKDYENMKKYYIMAINNGHTGAMNNLGNYYQIIEKDYEQMKKYYIMAIDKDQINAMINLGLYYQDIEKDYEQMKKYYTMVIDSGYDKSEIFNNLKLSFNPLQIYIMFGNIFDQPLDDITLKYINKKNHLKFINNGTCNICFEENIELMAMDCTHYFCSTNCYPKISYDKKCPQCRLSI